MSDGTFKTVVTDFAGNKFMWIMKSELLNIYRSQASRSKHIQKLPIYVFFDEQGALLGAEWEESFQRGVKQFGNNWKKYNMNIIIGLEECRETTPELPRRT
jgi:hypothetical protein